MTSPTPVTPEPTETPGADTVPAQRSEATAPDPAQSHDPWNRDAYTMPVGAATTTSDMSVILADPTSAFPTAAFPTGSEPTGPLAAGPLPTGELSQAEPVRKPRRRLVLAAAIVLPIVLIAAGGAYAARYWTGSSIVEPESAVPASVSLFARVDLHPGLRDQLDVNSLVQKFPTKGTSTTDFVTKIETSAAQAAGLSYDTDVKPWFAGEAGVAEWSPSATVDPITLLVLSSKDDAAAKAALAKVQSERTSAKLGYVLQGGYAIIAATDNGAQADAVAAAAATKAHNLADSAAYTSDLSHLSGNNLAIAYANLSALGPLLRKELAHTGSASSPLSGILAGGANPFAQLTGTEIVGASIVSDGVEIRAHSAGGAPKPAGQNVRSTVDAMPDTTAVGVAINGLDPNGASMKQLTTLLGTALGHLGTASPAISGAVTNLLTAKVISLSLTGLSGGLPSGTLAFDLRDAASAQGVQQAIAALTGGRPIPGLDISTTGPRMQVTMGGPAGSAKLGSSALYKETVAGMTTANALIYVDVQKLVAIGAAGKAGVSAADLAQVKPIKSIGISESGSDALIRIVIKK